MTQKHTPEPWDWFRHSDGQISIMGDIDGKDYHIAQILYTGFPEHAEANAKLMASAPRLQRERDHLRESLATLLAALDREPGRTQWWLKDVRDNARVALAETEAK